MIVHVKGATGEHHAVPDEGGTGTASPSKYDDPPIQSISTSVAPFTNMD